MKLALRLTALAVLLLVLAVTAAEMAGWPGLAPRAARYIAPGLGMTLDPDTRLHLIVQPRVESPSVRVVRGDAVLAEAKNLELRWRWRDLWDWQHEQTPLRLREVNAEQLDVAWSRDALGRSNWQSGKKSSGEPTPLPVIDALVIRHGNVHVDDAPLQLRADARFHTEADGRWQAQMDGELREQKLALQAEASAGLSLLSSPRAGEGQPAPARLQATLSQAKSRIQFDGTAASLLDARALDGRVEVHGPSLAAVGRPIGITLPATPPFVLKGRLQHASGIWQFTDAQGTIGRSQLAGDFKFNTRTVRPLLTGELRGGPLLLADLGPALGTDTEPSRSGRVLPDRQLDIPSLARMDADVNISLSALDLGSRSLAPFAPISARLQLQDNLLSLQDLRAGVAGGQISADATLSARVEPPLWQVKLGVQNMALEHWLRTTHAVTGRLRGQAEVQGTGRSTAALLGTLDGHVSLSLQDGTLSHLATELAGLDVAQGLGIWIRGDDALALNCARVEGRFKSGVLRPQMAVVDNKDSRIEIEGGLSLKTEQLGLRLITKPKDFSPMALRAPVLVQGSLADPKVKIEAKALRGRAVAALALGLVAPPAALLAFVDPGEKLPPLVCDAAPHAPSHPKTAG
ncbi:AsmA family protein [Burkholderiaceae bacterium UC74_6]